MEACPRKILDVIQIKLDRSKKVAVFDIFGRYFKV